MEPYTQINVDDISYENLTLEVMDDNEDQKINLPKI